MKKYKLYFALIPTAFSAVCGLSTLASCNKLSGPVFDISEDGVLTGFNHNWSKQDIATKLAGTDTLVIPNNVTQIANRAFYNPTSSTDIKTYTTIPDFIKTIDLSQATELTTIGEQAFIAAPEETIIFPNNIHYIDDDAFGYNYNLSCIDLSACDMFPIDSWSVNAWDAIHAPRGIIKVRNIIAREAWYQYFSINNHFSFSIETWVMDIQAYDDVFTFNSNNEISGFTHQFTSASESEQWKFLNEISGDGDTLLIPAYHNGSVKGVTQSAFYNSSDQKSTIPENISTLRFEEGSQPTTVYENAFKEAPFYSVYLASNVINIKQDAFYHLNQLEYIDASCFASLPTEWSDVGTTWKTESEYAGTIHLKINSTEHNNIADYFHGHGIPSTWSPTYKHGEIYDSTAGLLFGFFPDLSETEIYNMLDQELPNVIMNIDKNIKAVNNDAFYRNGLTTIPLPDGPETHIKLIFPNDSTCDYIGRRAFAKAPITQLELPDSLKTIDTSAFYNNIGLIDVTFPSELNDIGNYAFSNCPVLKSINIPNTLKTLGHYAFWGCSKLAKIDMSAFTSFKEVPKGWSKNNVFSGLPAEGTILISDKLSKEDLAILKSYLLVASNETIKEGKWKFE